ncbi:MAG: flagellar biosynthesis anti-sigma factor FlgM [Thermodesulfobacteriota bacterium]|uniref:Negative regulator of flagellin synthesis n=1 Tax=Desulfofervidus auxilii TaxID=1621989 RepID=A0A7C0Y4T3_DESA2|nr:MAG: flagellar biosynthesis anti-sigma factor FlgM [Thermodesulfobacteriota bacterium]HDD44438.1 flagellar biosynthesis anti-sigma factor FlgM [Candidatus Desulfofervidus auxilii]
MKINNITGKNIENLKDVKEARIREENLKVRTTKPEEKTTNQTEVIEISSQKLVERTVKKVLSMPEIREEKVAQIKAQIESGTYNVSNREIARAIIRNLLNEIA